MDLVFSDIHADIDALDTILDISSSKEFTKKYGSFSRLINLGDLLERGAYPKLVLTKMKSLEKNYKLFSVMGNHDEAFLYKRKVSGSSFESLEAHELLDNDDLSFFKENKDGTFGRQEFIDIKNGLFCVHGGPLDPKKITPAGSNESWLYQRTWQRLTEEDFEFFSNSGYHYMASSAFQEVKKKVRDHIIFAGHQHLETVIVNNSKITEIYSKIKPKHQKISRFIIESREIEIEPANNYLIRVGIGGPAGYYGGGFSNPHFAIVEYNPKKVILFTVKT